MTRRNRTPEEKARREKIRELLQLANIGSMDDIQNLFKETIADDDLIFKFGVQQIVPRDGHVLRASVSELYMITSGSRISPYQMSSGILVLIREVSAKLGTYASRSLSCAAILNAASVPAPRGSLPAGSPARRRRTRGFPARPYSVLPGRTADTPPQRGGSTYSITFMSRAV